MSLISQLKASAEEERLLTRFRAARLAGLLEQNRRQVELQQRAWRQQANTLQHNITLTNLQEERREKRHSTKLNRWANFRYT